MTDTLNKTHQSCTESDTPETKWFFSRANVDNWNDQLDFCERLERERDEAVNSCHIWQRGHSKLVADRDDWKRLAVEQEKDIDEWKAVAERWRSLAQGWKEVVTNLWKH
jgi:hypothetical protein